MGGAAAATGVRGLTCQRDGCETPLTGRQLKFCSADCRGRDAYSRQLKIVLDLKCKHCGSQLGGRQRVWCSLACKRAHDTEVAMNDLIATYTRKCKTCGLIKPLEQDYYKLPSGTYRRNCKACVMAGNSERNAKPDAAQKKRDQHLRGLYGITADEYEQMLTAQDGLCAVCRKPPMQRRLAVDHDHVTGLLRGLLCNYCNLRVIGKARNAELYRRAAEYLTDPPARRALGRDVIAPGRPTKKRRRKKR